MNWNVYITFPFNSLHFPVCIFSSLTVAWYLKIERSDSALNLPIWTRKAYSQPFLNRIYSWQAIMIEECIPFVSVFFHGAYVWYFLSQFFTHQSNTVVQFVGLHPWSWNAHRTWLALEGFTNIWICNPAPHRRWYAAHISFAALHVQGALWISTEVLNLWCVAVSGHYSLLWLLQA